MKTVLLGGSGFIGTALSHELSARGDQVIVPTRTPKHTASESKEPVLWNGRDPKRLAEILDGSDAVVNLLGENIAQGRWTPEKKERILASRLEAGLALVQAIDACTAPPRTLIQASATGYYGCWPDAASAPSCPEEAPGGKGFLADTARRWENSTRSAEDRGIRRCVIRTAPVLGPNGGFLQRLLPPFRYGLGGCVGSGRQPFPWIQLTDEVRAILFLLDNELSGPFNLAAPETPTMKIFAETLGKKLHRPVWLPMPAPLLRLALGEMADELLLAGQNAVPARLIEHGFSFRYPDLETALAATLVPGS